MAIQKGDILGRIKLDGVGWEIYDGTNRYGDRYLQAEPLCIKCKTALQLKNNLILTCQDRTCKTFGKDIRLQQDFTNESSLARRMWEAKERRNDKIQWTDFDRELLPLADNEDSDDNYWVKAFLYNSKDGHYLMVLAGNKNDKNNKVQFFVKDRIDLGASDHVGDLNPKQVFLGFKAQFSDGAITKTIFKGKEQPE